MKRPIIRDLLFYIVTVTSLFVIVASGDIRAWQTIGIIWSYVIDDIIAGYLALYAVYASSVVIGRIVRMRSRTKSMLSNRQYSASATVAADNEMQISTINVNSM